MNSPTSFPPLRRSLVVLAASLLISACASAPKPRAYTIEIALDSSLAGNSIQVDLIGANAVSDKPKWETYSVTEYWQPGNAMRRNADKVVLEFGQGKSNVQVFSSTDPAWKRWIAAGAQYLVVMVDLPGGGDDKSGNADSRRLLLELDAKKWPSSVDKSKIQLLVQESGIRLLTPMKTR
jgi:hypothetical protein